MEKTYFVRKGEPIFQEGNFSDRAFIVEYGQFEVAKTVENGNKVVLGIIKKNDIFGEIGLIDGKSRSATVTALEDSAIHEITSQSYNILQKHNPQALMPLLKILTKRLRGVNAIMACSS